MSMISTLVGRFITWRNRCRQCETDGIHSSLLGQMGNLREIAATKTVREFRCEKCGVPWVLADRSRFLSRVVRTELFEQWKNRQWTPTVTQTSVLNQIVGSPDLDSKNVYFPCTITAVDGTTTQRAIIIATTGDCFGKFPVGRDVALLEEHHQITASIYALSAEVRAATMAAKERSMGYSPVNVKDLRGNRYTLSSQMFFFDHHGVLGPEVMLDTSPYHGKNLVHPNWADRYFICDQFKPG